MELHLSAAASGSEGDTKPELTENNMETPVSTEKKTGIPVPVRNILIGLLSLVVLTAAFFGINFIVISRGLDSINLKNGQAFNNNHLVFQFNCPWGADRMIYKLDGDDISGRVSFKSGRVVIDLTGVGEGYHFLEAGFKGEYNSLTFYSPHRCYGFEVDTTIPVIKLESPKGTLVKTSDLTVSGKTEPCIDCTVKVNGKAYDIKSDNSGNFTQDVKLEKEKNNIAVIATDRAGNTGKTYKPLILDETPPVVSFEGLKDKAVITDTSINITVKVSDTGSGVRDAYLLIDGERAQCKFDSATGVLTTRLDNLDEGRYKIVAVATDNADWKTDESREFIVNARETLGSARVRPGAFGEDVKDIQRKLVKLGYLTKDKVTGNYGDETTKAVMAVQKKNKLPETGISDRDTILAMSEKIFVYLNEFSLYLVSPEGKVLKRYSIACGSPAYPTPTGDYFITDKQYNPAWYPPNSPWAKDSKPIPPGPGNPLGTRWIGLNANVVGIHGTSSPWSIGSAASHGCVRMYIPDVEELFELVDVGTPVSIYSNRPLSHRKYVVEKKKASKDDKDAKDSKDSKDSARDSKNGKKKDSGSGA
ncbi:MAG: L,D-transpeptidase family protein [Firmicutes bacterium]|nr:L,D-transpeptidase family protein [Bacillota bacterium]